MTMKVAALPVLLAWLLCGCAQIQPSARLDHLSFSVPPRFELKEDSVKDSAGDMVLSRWRSPRGEVLEVLAWPAGSVVDRGPMIRESEEPIEVAGQNTMLIRTKMFFGHEEDSLVVHLRQGDAICIVHATGMTAGDFKDIARSVMLEGK
jgi:hypothetical protein